MAIAIDSSSPPFVNNGAGFNTTLATAAFTPPAGSVIVAVAGCTSQNESLTFSSSPSLTWTSKVSSAVTGSALVCAIGWAPVSTSVSTTVTVTAQFNSSALAVGAIVLTGANTTTQNGQTTNNKAAVGPTGTLSSLVGSNSLVLGVVAASSATAPTIPSGQSDVFNSNTYLATFSASGVWVQYLTGINLSAGSSATINDTAPSATNAIVVAEILAGSGTITSSTPFYPHRMPLGA